MEFLWWLLGSITAVIIIILIYCFCVGFYASRKEQKHPEEYPLPKGEIYEPFYPQMRVWMDETRKIPCQKMSVTSFDGLTLRGRFYKYADSAPIEIMFPGYRGDARRDFCGAVQRSFALGHSVLVVDQRACGESDGHIISFGANESKDCVTWVNHVIEYIDINAKIILTGISMGAATVLITAGKELPDNVVGVLADCGYSSAEEIIKKVIKKDMKLPPTVFYPFVRLAGKLFGGFDIKDASPIEAMKKCSVPVLFAHGEEDEFVPCHMSQKMYEVCKSQKKLIMVPKAGHCLCYVMDIEKYIQELKDFWTEMNIYE